MADIELDALTEAVRRRAVSEAPLDLLRAAVEVTDRLSVTADELLSRQVAAARRAGAAWSQIGAVLGVSRQAAQQRFGDGSAMPEEIELPMTDRTRRAIRLARKEAKLLGAGRVDTGHLLLGVLRLGRGLAVQLLVEYGLDLDELVLRLDEQSGEGEQAVVAAGDPLTRDANEALWLAVAEARSLGHDYVGTEHVLLGLLRLGRGAGYAVLSAHQVEPDAVRERVTEILEGPSVATRGGRLRVRGKPR